MSIATSQVEDISSSGTSKSIPLISFGFAALLVLFELVTGQDTTVLLDAVMPLLIGLGLAGVPLAIAKRAIAAKKEVDTDKIRGQVEIASTNSETAVAEAESRTRVAEAKHPS